MKFCKFNVAFAPCSAIEDDDFIVLRTLQKARTYFEVLDVALP